MLAFLNFAFNICVGCIMYAQLVRIGLLPLRLTPSGAMILLARALDRHRGGRRGGTAAPGAARKASNVSSSAASSSPSRTSGSCRVCCTSPASPAPSATPPSGRLRARSHATIAPEAIEIREIDIAVEPEMARRVYRVMSLPTTIVLDASRARRTDINVGFANGEVLRRQLVEAGMPVAA